MNVEHRILINSQKVCNTVMIAKAGFWSHLKILDARLRGNDIKGRIKHFYETINLYQQTFQVFRC